MLGLLEALAGYVSVPGWLVIGLIVLFLISQVLGELIELCGKVAPGFLKQRKQIKEKRDKEKKRDELQFAATKALEENNKKLDQFIKLYDSDNISKRDRWMHEVDYDREDYHKHQEENRKQFSELRSDLAKNSEITLAMYIETKRTAIINFASKVIDYTVPVTHEEFRRIFKIYEEYEEIIEQNLLTNGEVDIAIRIIRDAYAERLKSRSFVEDTFGYNG